MRRLLFGLLLISTLFSLTLTVDPTTSSLDLGSWTIDQYSGFYGATAGNVLLTVSGKLPGTPANLYTNMQTFLTSPEGYELIDIYPEWKIYWASIDGTAWNGVDTTSSLGFSSWVKYRLMTDDQILLINPAVNTDVSITLGTQFGFRPPAVQPTGRYTTRIVYTVTQ